MIMNVHPSAVVDPPGLTTAEPFSPEALYEFKIDTDGDAVADIAYRVRFSSFEGGSQIATLRRVEGTQAAGMGDGGQVILAGASVSTGLDAWIAEAGAYRFFAGWRSDPFIFDVQGMLNNQQFSGADFFADKNSIVLEAPNSDFGRKRLGLWARTLSSASAAGSRWTAARCPRKRSSSSEGRETPTWQVNLRMMTASFPSSRTRSSTAAGMRRRKQGG